MAVARLWHQVLQRIGLRGLARQSLGYEPRATLAQGLRETWEWYTQNQAEHLRKHNYFKD